MKQGLEIRFLSTQSKVPPGRDSTFAFSLTAGQWFIWKSIWNEVVNFLALQNLQVFWRAEFVLFLIKEAANEIQNKSRYIFKTTAFTANKSRKKVIRLVK